MTDQNIVDIHGKKYMTVAGRVKEALAEKKLTIKTEIISHTPVVIKATVITEKGEFNGIAASYGRSVHETNSPYEVAETSAVGRALGFAGFGIIDGITTADEVKKETIDEPEDPKWTSVDDIPNAMDKITPGKYFCKIHEKDLKDRGNGVWDHRRQLNPTTLKYDPKGMWHWCTGKGWVLSSEQH